MGQPVAPSSLSSAALAGGKIGAALAIYELASKAKASVSTFRSNHFAFTVSVSEDDPLYGDIHAWLMSILPTEKHRALSVSSPSRNRGDDDVVSADDPASYDGRANKTKPLRVNFDDENERPVLIGGYRVKVRVSSPEQAKEIYNRDPKKIKFEAYSYDAQQAVISELNRINSERASVRKPVLKMMTPWGQWQTRSDLPPRTMASVSIPREQKERLIADLGRFLEEEDHYNKLAIPYHRSYMLKGPPGTGKTSVVKALANHFDLDLWYIGLADLTAESGLLDLLSRVGPRSLLLLEDIDTVAIAKDEDSGEKSTITIGSLLNALDGVSTPHGLITIMTTNHFETLDERLVRAGRMDVIEEVGWPTRGQVAEMYEHFYGKPGLSLWLDESDLVLEGLSMATFAEIFKRNLHHPDIAAEEAHKQMLL